jgi:DNA-binding response OmpR family regulator
MPEKILIVEDETALRESLAYTLGREGFDVQTVDDGPKALTAARERAPDIVLLDIMLPGMDGFEVCRRLRAETAVPILMLTAREEEIDRVVGLEMGADDYIVKPFHMRELIARIKAQLRRVRLIREEMNPPAEGGPRPGEPIHSGDLTIDIARGEALRDGRPLQLKPKEYELLLYFARHRGQVLSREQILQQVWGWDYAGDSRTVDVHVRWLREKIEPDPSNPARLVTVRSAGYRFEG